MKTFDPAGRKNESHEDPWKKQRKDSLYASNFWRGRQEKLRMVTCKFRGSLQICLISMDQVQQWGQAERECHHKGKL